MECGVSFSGSASGSGSGVDEAGPCVDFLTAVTTPAPKTGFYECTGGVDDQATVTWPGGSFFSPAEYPGIGPCYGAHSFVFTSSFNAGDTVTCEAGSWGSFIGCEITCCRVNAP